MTQKYIVGIDEAGRGPIAGPVAVGGARIESSCLEEIGHELITNFMRGTLKDSKKLSEKKRVEIFTWMQEKQKEGVLDFVVSMGSSKTIDEKGIVPTISKALSKVLTNLAEGRESDTKVLLDGGLKAPEAFEYQETIARGDEREVCISLASIAAKVMRDRYMVQLSETCEGYGFDRHKGYGTKVHYEAIGEKGLCEEHRRSFCRGIKL